MTTLALVGQRVTCTYRVVDQNGNPMLVQPPLDTAALWTDSPSAPGVDSNLVSADGTTDTVNIKAHGSDTVGVRVVVGGITFRASELIQVATLQLMPAPVYVGYIEDDPPHGWHYSRVLK